MKGKDGGALLQRAAAEEKSYNWIEAARLYEEAARSFLDRKMVGEAARVYKKLGHAYGWAGRTAETAEEHVRLYRSAVQANELAGNLFGQCKNKPERLECEAEALFANGFLVGSVGEAKKAFDSSYELFSESTDLYSKENDRESSARTSSRAAVSKGLFTTYCTEGGEIEQLSREGRDVADKAFKLAREIGDLQSLTESLFAEMVMLTSGMAVVPFRWDEDWGEVARKFLLKFDESLGFLKNCVDPLILGMAYLVIGAWQCFFGFQYIEDEKEQEEYLNKGLGLLEKALVLARKTRDSLVIIQCIFWLDWWALFGGRFEYIQKRIFDDLNEIVKVGKIYAGSHFFLRFYTNFLPAFYYSNFAQRSFFSAAERKSYAEKGIEHAKESLHTSSFILFSGAPYQALTWSYSQLAILAEARSERDEHARKMLQFAKEAEQIAEKVKGGYPRAVGYSSLYRAYKTLADIADNEEEKSRMLAAAIDAHKKYIVHAVESRTGIILVQMRLGLLYEELGITTGKTDPLVLARESFLHVIKESLERGYHFYAAAAHISAAHVEDRLGDHATSAEHYEKAIDAYETSLRTIEYRPLKDRVQEVTNYARAWNLIERAKAYHKREDHLPAKENYEKACEILKELPSYNYEAPY
nr:hypothetical protein [Candidatus Njordarchaeum guaymaensis]